VPDLSAHRRKPFKVYREDNRSLVDRESFLGQNGLLASTVELRQQDPSLNRGRSLFTLVFVRAFEVINGDKFPQRVSDTIHTENIDAEVKDAV